MKNVFFFYGDISQEVLKFCFQTLLLTKANHFSDESSNVESTSELLRKKPEKSLYFCSVQDFVIKYNEKISIQRILKHKLKVSFGDRNKYKLSDFELEGPLEKSDSEQKFVTTSHELSHHSR